MALRFTCINTEEMCFDEKRGSGVTSLACGLAAVGNGDVSSGQATITMRKQTEALFLPSWPCLQPSSYTHIIRLAKANRKYEPQPACRPGEGVGEPIHQGEGVSSCRPIFQRELTYS